MNNKGTLPIGWMREPSVADTWAMHELPLSTVLRHSLVQGTTGWGKSGFLLGLMLGLITRHPGQVGVVLVDPKGETAQELRDFFIPALSAQGCLGHIRPETMVCLEPFGPYGMAMNPLHPIDGIGAEVQANLVCGLVDGLIDGGLGPRMRGILSWLVRAVMALHGSLLDVVRLLTDDVFRHEVTEHLPDEELRVYLSTTFEKEPKASKESLRSRLEWLLLLPNVRAMLCAKGCVSGSALIEAPLTVVDLSGAPQGFSPAARFLGLLIFQLITAAIFARPTGQHPVLLVLDEWQELVSVAHEDLERILAQARFKGIGLALANQTQAQIASVSAKLAASLLTNVALRVAFRPDVADIKDLIPLLPITGHKVNPDYPDRLLSREEEKKQLLDELVRLPPRHALLANRVVGSAHILRTLGLPYAEAHAQAARLSPEQRSAWRQGGLAVPVSELEGTQARVQVVSQASANAGREAIQTDKAPCHQTSRQPRPVGRKRTARPKTKPKLVLP